MSILRRARRVPALAVPAVPAVLLALTIAITMTVQAQGQEVTPTAAPSGSNPPTVPTNLETSAQHDSVTLTWTASTDSTVTHYAVLRRNPAVDPSQTFHVIEPDTGNVNSHTDSTVAASTKYIYRVKSVSPTGVSRWSGYSAVTTPAEPPSTATPEPTATATPAPDPADLAPTNLQAESAAQGVLLTWTAPAEDTGSITGYYVIRQPTGDTPGYAVIIFTESTGPTYTDSADLPKGGTYTYEVQAARGTSTSRKSNQASVEIKDPAPSNLTAEVQGNSVILTWNPPTMAPTSVTGYEILRATDGGDPATLTANSGSKDTAYTDSTPVRGHTYTYRIKVLRDQEKSGASNEAKVEYPHLPTDLAPSGLTARRSASRVELTWAAPAADAASVTGYEILRAAGAGTPETLVANTGNAATKYTDSSAQSSEAYTYRVKALRSGSDSEASAAASVTAQEETAADNPAPSGLTYKVRPGGIDLSWTAPTKDADAVTGYRVMRRIPAEGDTLLVWENDTGTPDTAYTDPHATAANTTYVYRVIALRGTEASKWSNAVKAYRPTAEEFTPGPPAAVGHSWTVDEYGTATVLLVWAEPEGNPAHVTSYEVERAPASGDFERIASTNETSHTDSAGLRPSTTYRYRITALNETLRGQPSAPVTVSIGQPEFLPSQVVAAGLEVNSTDPNTAQASLTATQAGIHYLRYRSAATASWTDAATATAQSANTQVTFNLTGLLPNAVYHVEASMDSSYPSGSTSSGTFMNRPDERDIDLDAENREPRGIWSDGTTIWVVNDPNQFNKAEKHRNSQAGQHRAYAYNLSTGARDTAKDITLDETPDGQNAGLHGHPGTLYVADSTHDHVKAYQLTAGTDFGDRQPAKDVPLDSEATLAALIMPTGIWSDGSTLYSVGHIREKLYAHNVGSTGTYGERQTGRECELAPDYAEPRGAWSNGSTMWVADSREKQLVAYALTSSGCQAHQPFQDLRPATGNNNPWGVWSDGTTLWVSDHSDRKLYAYYLPPAPPAGITSAEIANAMPTDVGNSTVSTDITVTIANAASDSKTVTLTYWTHPDGTPTTLTETTTTAAFSLTGLTRDTRHSAEVRVDSGDPARLIFRTRNPNDVIRQNLRTVAVEPHEASFPWVRQAFNGLRANYTDTRLPAGSLLSQINTATEVATGKEITNFLLRWGARIDRNVLIHELAHVYTIGRTYRDRPTSNLRAGWGYKDLPTEYVAMGWLYFIHLADPDQGNCNAVEIYADALTFTTIEQRANRTSGYFQECSNRGNKPTADDYDLIDDVLAQTIPAWFIARYEASGLSYSTSDLPGYTKDYDLEKVQEDAHIGKRSVAPQVRDGFQYSFGGLCPKLVENVGGRPKPVRNPWRVGNCVPLPVRLTLVTESNGGIRISWERPPYDGGADVTKYVLMWREPGQDFDDSRTAELDATARTHTLGQLPIGSEIRFAAHNQNGEGNPVRLVDDDPTPVRNLTVIKQNDIIDLSWDAPENPPAAYVVQWKTHSQNWDQASETTLQQDATSHQITGLERDTAYEVRLKTLSPFGRDVGTFSYAVDPIENLRFTTETVTEAVAAKRCHENDTTQCTENVPWWQARVRLTWDPPAEDADIIGYRIERKSDQSSDNPGLWQRPQVRQDNEETGEVTFVDAPDTTGTTFTDTGPHDSGIYFTGNPDPEDYGPVIYSYRVRGVDAHGNFSPTVSVTLPWKPQGPGAPTAVTASLENTGAATSSITIGWSPPSEGPTVTGYHVYRHIRAIFDNSAIYRYGEPVATLTASETSYTDTTVVGVREYLYEYTYAVRAISDGHTDMLSDRVKLRRNIDEDGAPYIEVSIDSFGPP